MHRIDFYFANDIGEEVNPRYAELLVALFDCATCYRTLRFQKEYEPVPMHYESLLRICESVTCPKCGQVHRHDRVDGEDVVVPVQTVDPNQLELFHQ